MHYRTCPECGASLDPGEHCDCFRLILLDIARNVGEIADMEAKTHAEVLRETVREFKLKKSASTVSPAETPHESRSPQTSTTVYHGCSLLSIGKEEQI